MFGLWYYINHITNVSSFASSSASNSFTSFEADFAVPFPPLYRAKGRQRFWLAKCRGLLSELCLLCLLLFPIDSLSVVMTEIWLFQGIGKDLFCPEGLHGWKIEGGMYSFTEPSRYFGIVTVCSSWLLAVSLPLHHSSWESDTGH